MENNETIFADQAPVVQEVVSSTAPAPESKPAFTIPTEVNGLVGEGKKYRSVEDALKSVPHAQTHIQKLEDEAKQLREELAKRRTAEELLEEIKRGQIPQQQTTGSVEANPEVLSQIVEQVLEKKTFQQQAQQNTKSVADKFTAVYGDKAEQVYNDIARNMGMSPQELNMLAVKSPNAVLKLAGLDSKQIQQPGRLQSDVSIPMSTNYKESSVVLPRYATTKDVMKSYEAAKEKILKQYKG